MTTISITLPDGSKAQTTAGMSIGEFVRQHIGEGLARAAIAATVNETVVDLSYVLTSDCTLRIHTLKDETGKKTLWHSTAHVLAMAVVSLYPDAKLTIGPATDEGFYYDFAISQPFTPEELPKIEERMRDIVKKDVPFTRFDVTLSQARALVGNNSFKQEIIDTYADSQLTFYKTGDAFEDLCSGPHIPSTGRIKAFKLLRIAGAYWRGDSTKPQLQRIYGISFGSNEELKQYVDRIEQAQLRDHRKLVREHNLVMFHEFAPGMPFFLTKGAIVYNQLIAFIRQQYILRGFEEVITPQLYNKKLWETSGHWEHYREDMFVLKMDEQECSLKPMNCPSHCLIYKNSAKSYRDLPLRIADFCCLHRNELSGALSGLTRVRKFSQDDAHIFCTFDQIEAEVLGTLEFIKFAREQVFGFKLNYYLSTRPEKYLGTTQLWDQAETLLANALKTANISFSIKEGNGAFYGPKIDIDMEDALGRKWQCPTCQLDFNLPQRFELTYEGADGQQHQPVMIHRAVLGSLERCFAMLVEHYAGKFPLWLSPQQVRLLPIADRHVAYCKTVAQEMKLTGIRADVDDRALTTPNKVRQAQTDQVNYILVVGDREVQNATINIRTRDNVIVGEKSVSELISQIKEQISAFK